MRKKLCLVILITTQLVTGCASTQGYLPPPSQKDNSPHLRSQLPQPSSLQKTGAFISGVIGGALGPLGIIVTKLGSSLTTEVAMQHFWNKFSHAEILGVVIEDVTERRKMEIRDHQKLFTNLPSLNNFPKHYSVDLGSGHGMIMPTNLRANLKPGDLVRVVTSENVSKLQITPVDYKQVPTITDKICDAEDRECLRRPENEIGVVGYVATN